MCASCLRLLHWLPCCCSLQCTKRRPSVHASHGRESACGRTSPAFTIDDAPKETESLRFMMNDKDAPNFRHGGSTVPYNGSGRVPEGAIDYIGPCPPAGTSHRYVWTIEALDKSGKNVARAAAEGRFPVR